MLTKRQVALLLGLTPLLASASARAAAGVCALEDRVEALESQVATLNESVGPAGASGPRGARGAPGEPGPAGDDASDETEAEYQPRLASLTDATSSLGVGVDALLASADALELKLVRTKTRLSELNRNYYLIEGLTSKLGGQGYPVLSWPTGVAPWKYALGNNNYVQCQDPVAQPDGYCIHSAVFTPGYIVPENCTTNSTGALSCAGEVTSVQLTSAPVVSSAQTIALQSLDIQVLGSFPTNLTQDYSAYFQNLNLDPVVVSGVCLSSSTPNGYDLAGEWAREPALRVAKAARLGAPAIEEFLREQRKAPTGVDLNDAAALAKAQAAYDIALQGIRALAAGSEQEAANYIYAAATRSDHGPGLFRYLYALEQAEAFIDGLRGRSGGWSAAKLASFKTTRTRVSYYVDARRREIRNRAYALNAEWRAAVLDAPLSFAGTLKSPYYPDIIQIAIDDVNQQAQKDAPPDVGALLAGTTLLVMPFAGAVAAGLISAAVGAVFEAGGTASLFLGVGTFAGSGTGAIGAAGAVGVVAFPVVVLAMAVVTAVVAGEEAWEVKSNHDRYDAFMAQAFDTEPNLAELSDDALRAAFVDWQLGWLPKQGLELGCL